MNVGAIICGVLGLLFLLLTCIFMIGKEKAATLISGFNSYSKEERKQFDQEMMSKDQVKLYLLCTCILEVGMLLSYLVSDYIAFIAIVIWLYIFFKNVHFDDEKAFGKYRKQL